MYAMTEVCEICRRQTSLFDGCGNSNILENIALGVDMFDCVMPTRNARNGMLFTANGTINIKIKNGRMIFLPSMKWQSLMWIQIYKAYLRHLFAANEYLGKQIATIHNLGFYMVGS
jgi:queuine tRNA-ribosyltransferase